MTIDLEFIRELTESNENFWLQSSKRKILPLIDIPNSKMEEIIAYWGSIWKNPSSNKILKEDHRTKKMLKVIDWLSQTNNRKVIQKKTKDLPHPMTRQEGVQLFAKMLYRYYYGDLRKMLDTNDYSRKVQDLKQAKKNLTSKKSLGYLKKEGLDQEYQAINLAFQFVVFIALNKKADIRESVITASEVLLKSTPNGHHNACRSVREMPRAQTVEPYSFPQVTRN